MKGMMNAMDSKAPAGNWQTEEDLRTLCKAKEIEKDPKRLKECQKMARQKMKEMGAVAGDMDMD